MVDINVPAIEKLLDYGASGVGAIAGAMLAPWKASREGKARLIAARADADVRLVEAESQAKTSLIIAEARSEARQYLVEQGDEVRGSVEITRDDIVQHIEFQGRKRLSNARAVLEGAADALVEKEVKEVVDHEPDPDWTARFFDCVQDVSAEDLQKIWARILAGEVESPGRTSFRTLDALRNMTKRDAEMFRDICPLIIGGDFVFYEYSVIDMSALAFNNLLHLQDCGLVDYQASRPKSLTWGKDNYILLVHLERALVIKSNSTHSGELSIPAVRLTSPGRELGGLSPQTVNMDYLRAFSKFLKSKDCRLKYLPNVVHLPDGVISYSRSIPKDPESEEIEEQAQ